METHLYKSLHLEKLSMLSPMKRSQHHIKFSTWALGVGTMQVLQGEEVGGEHADAPGAGESHDRLQVAEHGHVAVLGRQPSRSARVEAGGAHGGIDRVAAVLKLSNGR